MPRPVETPELPSNTGFERTELEKFFPVVPQINAPTGKDTGETGSYVKYLAEDEHAYQVRTRSRRMFEVDKRRTPVKSYPPAQPGPSQTAYRWLALAALGLAFSGVGALLLAPVAGITALRAQRENLSAADDNRLRLVVFLSGVLMALGAGLAYLFWVHVRG